MNSVKKLEIEGTFVSLADLQSGDYVLQPNKYYIDGVRVSEQNFIIEQEMQRNIYHADNGIAYVKLDASTKFSNFLGKLKEAVMELLK